MFVDLVGLTFVVLGGFGDGWFAMLVCWFGGFVLLLWWFLCGWFWVGGAVLFCFLLLVGTVLVC